MKRYFESLRTRFKGDFGGFLRFAIQESRCDRFTIEHFSFCTGGYIFKGDYETLQRELDEWSR